MRQCKVFINEVEAGLLQDTDDPLKLRYWQSYNYRRITLE